MDQHLLSQYVNLPTRESNILDICLTNNDKLVYSMTSQQTLLSDQEKLLYNISSERTVLSDHNTVDIMLSSGELSSTVPPTPAPPPLTGFRSLNLFDADYTAIREEISKIDWETSWNDSNLDDFPQFLHDSILEICRKCSLPKVQPNSRFQPKQGFLFGLFSELLE